MPSLGYKFFPKRDRIPLKVKPLTTAGPQPWHLLAIKLRVQGMTVRGIAKELDLGFGPVQRFLNPESKRKQKVWSAEYERNKRRTCEEYAQEIRDYNRRYAQLWAILRYKKARGLVKSDSDLT